MADVLTTAEDVACIVRDAPTRVGLFAYGTLRPGEILHRVVDVVDSTPGEVYGYGLFTHPRGSYPYLVRHKGATTVGDILWTMPNTRLLETVRMEMRAGYQVQVVNVYTQLMDEPIPALAFVYPYQPVGTALIETGDWRDV